MTSLAATGKMHGGAARVHGGQGGPQLGTSRPAPSISISIDRLPRTHQLAPTGRDQADSPQPETTIELFFDLVLVFTIIQLTDLLVHRLDPPGIVQLLLIFGVSYWMYGD